MESSPPEHDYLAANTASSDEGMEVTNPDDPGALCSDRVCGDRLCVSLGCHCARMFTRMQAQTFQTQDCESGSLPPPPTLFLGFFISVSPTFKARSGGGLYSDVAARPLDQTRVMRIVGRGLPLLLFYTTLFLRQYTPLKNTNRLKNKVTQKTIHALITTHKSQGPLSVNTQISLAKNP